MNIWVQFVQINCAHGEALKPVMRFFLSFQNKSSCQVCLWACVKLKVKSCYDLAVKNVFHRNSFATKTAESAQLFILNDCTAKALKLHEPALFI